MSQSESVAMGSSAAGPVGMVSAATVYVEMWPGAALDRGNRTPLRYRRSIPVLTACGQFPDVGLYASEPAS